ncbi:MAG: helix-turn-helix transcriptional regulator [Nitrospirales bacterium]|nr:helix-turn-helix transcriptional regulator [Nitrospirales bacterium]
MSLHMGKHLELSLKERKIKQVDIAAKLKTSKQRIGQLIRTPSWRSDTIVKVSDALGVPVSYWFGR